MNSIYPGPEHSAVFQVNKKIDLDHTAEELFKNYNEKLVPIYGTGKKVLNFKS